MSNSKTGGVPAASASASAGSMSSLPTTKILFRSKKNVELCAIDDVKNRSCDVLASGYSTFHVFHPNGNEVLIQFPSKGIVRCDLTRKEDSSSSSSGSDVFLKESTRIGYCMYSPKGSYVLTWERAPPAPKKDSNVVGGNGTGNGNGSGTGCTSTESSPVEFLNLKIWNGSTGEYLWGFPLKNLKREQWPPLQWTHDECFAFHMVTNHLHVYKGQDIFLHSSSTAPRYESRKIRCEGISSFSVPQSAVVIPTTTNGGGGTSALDVVVKYLVSTFVAESKGKPAKLALLRYPDALGPASKSKPPVAAKSFYQAEECLVKWSPKGDAALVLTSTTVDSSGSSYYGSSNLYLLNASAGTCEPVPLPGEKNDGPVHDVAWMPNAQAKGPPIFAMLSGRMPALGSLHHGGTAQPTFLFGNAHRNTIAWSKHGRFVNLAGFGNLAGGMDFWDRNKCKPIPIYYSPTDYDKPSFGQTAPCAVGYGWSPNSRYFMVSTTSPRMNVDNGVKVFKYSGLQLANLPWDSNKYSPDQLLAADFVPTPFTDYPDRPQTPPPRRPKLGPDTAHHNNSNSNNNNTAKHSNSHHPNSHHHAAKHDPTSTASTTTTESYVKPPGRYVPPAARRAAGGTTSLADRMRREREGNTMGPTKINSHNSLKLSGNHHNKKRLPVGMTVTSADMNTTNGSTAAGGGGKSKNALRRERQRQAKQKAALAAATTTTTTATGSNTNNNNEPTPPTTPAPKETVSPEKILKKLRKQLKQIEQLKEKDFDSLNDDQKEKLANEQQILKQLKSLKL